MKGGGCAVCKKYNTNSPNAWKHNPLTIAQSSIRIALQNLFAFGNGNSMIQNGKKSHYATFKEEVKSSKHTVRKINKSSRMQKRHHKKSRQEEFVVWLGWWVMVRQKYQNLYAGSAGFNIRYQIRIRGQYTQLNCATISKFSADILALSFIVRLWYSCLYLSRNKIHERHKH